MQRDLFVLTADRNMQDSLIALLRRPQSIGMRKIEFTVERHPDNDPGCYGTGCSLLDIQSTRFEHALLLFDYEWDHGEKVPECSEEIENSLNGKLTATWGDRAAAIVIVPELERWVWSKSPHVDSVLQWQNDIRKEAWLKTGNFEFDTDGKPKRPKEALDAVLKKTRVGRSSSLYSEIAEKVSLAHCQDPAFNKLLHYLRTWFPIR